jgi:hypothetical protein
MPDAPRQPEPPDDEEADRRASNIFLLVAAVLVIGSALWLMDALLDARRADECMSAGRRNCSPVEVPAGR